MKYKSLGLTVLLAAFAGSALAQETHISVSGSNKCKPDGAPQSIDIGDRAGHQFLIMKFACDPHAALVIAGVKDTKSSVTEATEMDGGGKFQERGYDVLTMENGDKVYARTQDVGNMTKEEWEFHRRGYMVTHRWHGQVQRDKGRRHL